MACTQGASHTHTISNTCQPNSLHMHGSQTHCQRSTDTRKRHPPLQPPDTAAEHASHAAPRRTAHRECRRNTTQLWSWRGDTIVCWGLRHGWSARPGSDCRGLASLSQKKAAKLESRAHGRVGRDENTQLSSVGACVRCVRRFVHPIYCPPAPCNKYLKLQPLHACLLKS